MPKHLESIDVPAVAAAMQEQAEKLQSFTCEMRVTFFGPDGKQMRRLKDRNPAVYGCADACYGCYWFERNQRTSWLIAWGGPS